MYYQIIACKIMIFLNKFPDKVMLYEDLSNRPSCNGPFIIIITKYTPRGLILTQSKLKTTLLNIHSP